MAEKPATPRQFKMFGAVYTEFGKLTRVEDAAEWIHIFNEDDHYVSMKKIYAGWARVLINARNLIGREILIETGASSSNTDYFRDIVPENDSPEFFGRIFDNLPNTQIIPNKDNLRKINMEIIRLRIYKNRLHYSALTYQEQYQQLAAQLEQMNDKEVKENKIATAALTDNIQDFVENPNRTLLIAGQCINKSTYPKQIDVSFAMRLKINVTRRRRIDIHVLKHIKGTNKLHCRLPGFRDEECIIGVRQSDVKGTRNQWAAVHVENFIPGWWQLENTKKYKDQKNRRQEISYFLNLHDEMVSELTKVESSVA